jgi:hypothetical protein
MWLRDSCVSSSARPCSVVPNATGATRIWLMKSMVQKSESSYEPGGREFESLRARQILDCPFESRAAFCAQSGARARGRRPLAEAACLRISRSGQRAVPIGVRRVSRQCLAGMRLINRRMKSQVIRRRCGDLRQTSVSGYPRSNYRSSRSRFVACFCHGVGSASTPRGCGRCNQAGGIRPTVYQQ